MNENVKLRSKERPSSLNPTLLATNKLWLLHKACTAIKNIDSAGANYLNHVFNTWELYSTVAPNLKEGNVCLTAYLSIETEKKYSKTNHYLPTTISCTGRKH